MTRTALSFVSPAAPRWIAIRDELRARKQLVRTRKQARVLRLSLETELATYTTRNDLDDLHAILDRTEIESPDVAEMRRIVSRRIAA